MISYPQYAAPQGIDFVRNFSGGFGVGQGMRQEQRRSGALERMGQLQRSAPMQPQGGILSQIGNLFAPQEAPAPQDPQTQMINASHAVVASSVDPALSSALGAKYGNATQPTIDPAKQALNFFVERGYSPHQAAGIVGNLMQESGLNVGARNPGDGRDGSDSIGIAQWNGPRAQALSAYAGQNGGNVNDLMTQLGFIDHELNTTEAAARERLIAAQDPIQAAAAFAGYERPAGWSADNPYGAHGWSNRAQYAAQFAGGNFAMPTTAEGAANAMALNSAGMPDVGAGQGMAFDLSNEDIAILMSADETRPFAMQYLQGMQQRAESSGRFVMEQGPNGSIWQRDRLTGQMQVLMEGQTADDGMTDTQRNLMWRAEQAGLQPGTPEYQAFMASGGAGAGLSISADGQGGFSVTQGGPGGKFGQTVDAGLGGEYITMQQDALSAMRGIASLDAMEQAMSDPSFYSGFGSEQIMGLKRAAAAIGIDPEGVTSMETFGALSKQAVLDAMGGSLGAGFSNADRDFVEQQVPTLANTPEGNKALLGIQRQLQQRKIEIANLAEQFRLANGNMNGFVQYLSEWATENPVFVSNMPDAVDMGGGITIRQVR